MPTVPRGLFNPRYRVSILSTNLEDWDKSIEGRPLSNPHLPQTGTPASGPATLASVPWLCIHLPTLWHRSYYRLFPLVMVAATCLLIWRWIRSPAGQETGPPIRVWPFLVTGLTLLVLAVICFSPWLAATDALLALAGWLSTFRWPLRESGPAWAILRRAIQLGLMWRSAATRRPTRSLEILSVRKALVSRLRSSVAVGFQRIRGPETMSCGIGGKCQMGKVGIAAQEYKGDLENFPKIKRAIEG